MHGLFSWNVAAHKILAHFGASDAADLFHFEARFVAPVRPGDRLDILMWALESPATVDEDTHLHQGSDKLLREIRFIVKVGEKVVLDDGRAQIASEQSKCAKL